MSPRSNQISLQWARKNATGRGSFCLRAYENSIGNADREGETRGLVARIIASNYQFRGWPERIGIRLNTLPCIDSRRSNAMKNSPSRINRWAEAWDGANIFRPAATPPRRSFVFAAPRLRGNLCIKHYAACSRRPEVDKTIRALMISWHNAR